MTWPLRQRGTHATVGVSTAGQTLHTTGTWYTATVGVSTAGQTLHTTGTWYTATVEVSTAGQTLHTTGAGSGDLRRCP